MVTKIHDGFLTSRRSCDKDSSSTFFVLTTFSAFPPLQPERAAVLYQRTSLPPLSCSASLFPSTSIPVPLSKPRMLQAPPPTGPRAARTSGRLASSRTPSRGGIQKRGSTPVRVDKDGDVAMGAVGAGVRASGSRRGTAIRGSALNRRHDPLSGRTSRPSRMGIDTSAIQKTILRSMGSDEPLSKGPRSSLRGVRGRDRGRDRTHDTRDPLDRITVTGLKQSKAAGNPDGGVSDLIGFLERKATNPGAPAREAVKIKKVCLTLQSTRQQRHLISKLSGLLSFQAKLSKRRPRYYATAPGRLATSRFICLANVV